VESGGESPAVQPAFPLPGSHKTPRHVPEGRTRDSSYGSRPGFGGRSLEFLKRVRERFELTLREPARDFADSGEELLLAHVEK